ncbi:hypothetical protein DV738_g757, partial [Chaetothyriales sp. CBS 135597]
MAIHVPRLASPASSLIALPEYIVNSFFPGARPLLAKYPTLFRLLGFLLAFWYLEPIARLQSLWSKISTLVVATVTVASDEDLFGYMSTYLYERKTLRPDQKLNAFSNPLQEHHSERGHRHGAEESSKSVKQEPKIKYERARGTEFFVHKGRLFWASRTEGDGHQYYGHRYRRAEVLSISCLGRSTAPIQDLMEQVFHANKDKEKTLTIIRRPHTSGYSTHLSWSRLTSKPRRALNTVVLEATQKSATVADIREYMDESTAAFYGSHGIPYRRGYMFYGPPGTGKTSFALALASEFNLDVYVLSLLDQALNDSDLISLFNQRPGRSLLLLEDIDTAGLSKRKSVLSGLLNAIDGVAAPEGHILIITTNKPYTLDDALVRAGRISVRVPFTNTTKMQARGLFTRMYVDAGELLQSDANLALEKRKYKFAAALPEQVYSPADLQDYLLGYKKDPISAVDHLPQWIAAQAEERERREAEIQAEHEKKRKRKSARKKEWVESIKSIVKETDEKEDAFTGDNKEGSGVDDNPGDKDQSTAADATFTSAVNEDTIE